VRKEKEKKEKEAKEAAKKKEKEDKKVEKEKEKERLKKEKEDKKKDKGKKDLSISVEDIPKDDEGLLSPSVEAGEVCLFLFFVFHLSFVNEIFDTFLSTHSRVSQSLMSTPPSAFEGRWQRSPWTTKRRRMSSA